MAKQKYVPKRAYEEDLPQVKKRKFKWLDILLALLLIGSTSFAAWTFTHPHVTQIPDMPIASVDPNSVNGSGGALDGANSGLDPNTEQKQYDSVKIPGVGNADDGRDANQTNETEDRPASGDPISPAVAAACPGLANGSMCLPSLKKVIYYHPVGTYMYKGTNQMQIPSTYSVGWLNSTATPGSDKGTSLFAAHVIFNGGALGPFYNLTSLRVGNDIIIRTMEGHNFLYRIYRTDKIPKDSIPDDLYSKNGDPRVALVTCTGTYVQNLGYTHRDVVLATPVRA